MAAEVAPWDSPAPAAAEVAPWDSPAPDTSASPAAAPDETVGRVAGLGARALGRGVAELPSAVAALANPIQTGLTAGASIGHKIRQSLGWDPADQPAPAPAAPAQSAKWSDLIRPERWADAVDLLADKAGLARPATPTERVLSKAVEALPSATLAPEAPILGGLSAAAGGAASQATAEAGGSPLQQTLAGLAVGSVPAIAANSGAIARAITGGDSAATVAARNAAATDAGTTLTAGQATGSKVLQKIEATSGNIWGGGAIEEKGLAQAKDIQNRIDGIVNNLSPDVAPSPTAAGEAINAGGATAKANLRAAEQAAYAKVDAQVPSNLQVTPTNTVAALDSIAGPRAGAEQITALQNPQMQNLREQVTAQLEQNGGTLPYNAVVDLRSQVGALTASADGSVRGPAKQLFKALSADRDAAASSVSPEAAQAVNSASNIYKANLKQHDFLDSIIDKAGGPESVYQAATNGTKLGATKISGIMSAITPEQQNIVRATVLDRLGRAVPSAQGAAGSTFDAGTFLTNWNKLDTSAKDALFNGAATPKSLRTSLDSLADTIETLKNSKALRNPGGTAKAAGHSLGLWGLLTEAGGAITTGVVTGHIGAGIATAAGSVGAAAGAAGVNALLARALTNPRTAAWLAQTAKLPAAALPNAINQLGKMGQVNNNQDAKDLAASLQPQMGSQ